MNNSIAIIILLGFICALIVFILAIIKHSRTKSNNLRKISEDLCKILDKNTDEKIMLFTDDKNFVELNTQINRILDERQKMKADYRRSQLFTKRMLSNISHDIRTPMTVIQGYIEIMLTDDKNDIETLKKIEAKTIQVTELTDFLYYIKTI